MQQRPPTTSALPHTGRRRWLRALGALVACAGGFAAYFFAFQSPFLFVLIVAVVSLVAALLWGAWWGVVAVPAALWVGALAADVVSRAYAIHGALSAAPIMALDLIVVAGLPAMVGAVVGTSTGRWLGRQSHQ